MGTTSSHEYRDETQIGTLLELTARTPFDTAYPCLCDHLLRRRGQVAVNCGLLLQVIVVAHVEVVEILALELRRLDGEARAHGETSFRNSREATHAQAGGCDTTRKK